MTKSESIQNLAKALCEFQGKGIKVKKDSDNPYFKSKYADLSDILDTIMKPLSECGLSVSQMPDGKGLTTFLMHESGEWISSTYEFPIKETTNPQAHGAGITYAKRYSLTAILGLNIGETDDDAESVTDHSASLPYMVVDSAPYHAAVKYVAEGGSMSDVYKKYRFNKDTLADFEIDVAKYNDPPNPGQKQIGLMLDRKTK